MEIAELRRLKQLEQENQKRKQLVADLTLGKHMLQDILKKKVTPAQQRPMVQYLRSTYGLGIRRACRVIPLARSTYRYLKQSTEVYGAMSVHPQSGAEPSWLGLSPVDDPDATRGLVGEQGLTLPALSGRKPAASTEETSPSCQLSSSDIAIDSATA